MTYKTLRNASLFASVIGGNTKWGVGAGPSVQHLCIAQFHNADDFIDQERVVFKINSLEGIQEAHYIYAIIIGVEKNGLGNFLYHPNSNSWTFKGFIFLDKEWSQFDTIGFYFELEYSKDRQGVMTFGKPYIFNEKSFPMIAIHQNDKYSNGTAISPQCNYFCTANGVFIGYGFPVWEDHKKIGTVKAIYTPNLHSLDTVAIDVDFEKPVWDSSTSQIAEPVIQLWTSNKSQEVKLINFSDFV